MFTFQFFNKKIHTYVKMSKTNRVKLIYFFLILRSESRKKIFRTEEDAQCIGLAFATGTVPNQKVEGHFNPNIFSTKAQVI